MSRVRLFSALALVALIVIVALQNTEPVQTRILFTTVAMPRAVLIFISGAVGFGVGLLVSLFRGQKAARAR